VRRATAKLNDHSANEEGEVLQEISTEVSYRWVCGVEEKDQRRVAVNLEL
jgi:hypothetical protein